MENNYVKGIRKMKISQSNLIKNKSINAHLNIISSLSVFPSGNIISVSWDKTIKIWDLNFNLLSTINDNITDYIVYVSIKDENTFAISLYDRTVKIFKKNKNNKYILSEEINNHYEDLVNKLIFFQNGTLILSSENKIDIFEEIKENKHQLNLRLMNKGMILSMIFIKEKQYLIASGNKGTYFYTLNNYDLILEINNAICITNNSLCKIKDKIFIGGDNGGYLYVISINEKKIIKIINNEFTVYGICGIEDKSLLITCGWNKNIKIYNCDNYICIQIIRNAHDENIQGLIELNNGNIASYSDKIINVWSFDI